MAESRKAVINPRTPKMAHVEPSPLRCGPSTVAGIESHLNANRTESGNGLPQSTPVGVPAYGSSSVAAISRWSEPLALPTKQLRTRQESSARMWSRRIQGTPAGQRYCRVQGNE